MKESTSLDDLEKQQKPHATAPWHYRMQERTYRDQEIRYRYVKTSTTSRLKTQVQNQLTATKSFMNENSFK
jgi:hypothetical protein